MTETKRTKRVTLSAERLQAIYNAVHRPLMDARIAATKLTRSNHALCEELDELLYAAQVKAAADAVRAAGGEP